jgi:ABC-type multidrug transport system fused ATPase/permease subunit
VGEAEREGRLLEVTEHHGFLLQYGALTAAMLLLSAVYNAATYRVMARASTALHSALLAATMHAPLAFFDSTPLGRIINRFTSDLEAVDRTIPIQMADLIYCFTNIVSVFILVCCILPHLLVGLIPVLGCLAFLQTVFSRGKCQLKRLEVTAKAPILSQFREAVSGTATIRAFREETRFEADFHKLVERHLTANYASDMSSRS